MEFDALISPLDRTTFAARYWEKTCLHQKGVAGRFAGLMNWDGLNELLENHRLQPEHLKLVREGSVIPPEKFFRTMPGAGNIARIESGCVTALLASGASLLLESVGELSSAVRALSRSVCSALKCRNGGASLYASWHAVKGFGPHWHPHGVLALQLAGRKRWQIHAPTEGYPIEGDMPPPPVGAPVLGITLEDGDLLYLPRGWWHAVSPFSRPSLHLSLSLKPATGADLLHWAVEQVKEETLARQTVPLLDDDAAQAAHLGRLRDLLSQALSGDALSDFAGHLAAPVRGRPPMRLLRGPYDQLGPLRDDSRIRLAATNVLKLERRGEKVQFQAYGKTYSVPAFVAPALARLSDTKGMTVAELIAALGDSKAAAELLPGLALLARAGVVLVENPE